MTVQPRKNRLEKRIRDLEEKLEEANLAIAKYKQLYDTTKNELEKYKQLNETIKIEADRITSEYHKICSEYSSFVKRANANHARMTTEIDELDKEVKRILQKGSQETGNDQYQKS
jgi:chromosome segregation ATPase